MCVYACVNFIFKGHYENVQGEGVKLEEYETKDRTLENAAI